MRRLILFFVCTLCLLGWLSPQVTYASTPDLVINTERVLVNKLGAITISGSSMCDGAAQLVKDYYGDALGDQKVTVGISLGWTAYQPVGRNKIISATFASDYIKNCYNEFDYGYDYPICTDNTNPCPWITSHYGSTSTPAYIFSPNGKFSPGSIYVDVIAGAQIGIIFLDNVPISEEDFANINLDLFQIYGSILKAVR